MPNWVNVTICADKAIIKSILNNKGQVDFELLMPIPSELKDYSTGSTVSLEEQAKRIVKNKLKYGNGNFEIPPTKQDEDRFEKIHGARNWYDWCVEYWGTKWNAQDTEQIDKNTVSFSTAWNEPYNWIHHLSLKFPGDIINVTWEEEQGFGENYSIVGGFKEIIEEWDMPEFDDVDVDGVDSWVLKCTQSGGLAGLTNEMGEVIPKFQEGKYYLDYDEHMEFSSIEEIIKWNVEQQTGIKEAN